MLASGFLGHRYSWGLRSFGPGCPTISSVLVWDKRMWKKETPPETSALFLGLIWCCLATAGLVFCTEWNCRRRCCCIGLLLRKKAGWCFSPGCSSQVAIMEWEHETQRKTMNSGKVRVRPAAEERLQRYLQRVFWKKKKKEQTTYILMKQKQYWKTTYYPYSDQKNMKINTSDIRPLQQESRLSNKSASHSLPLFLWLGPSKEGAGSLRVAVEVGLQAWQLHSRSF